MAQTTTAQQAPMEGAADASDGAEQEQEIKQYTPLTCDYCDDLLGVDGEPMFTPHPPLFPLLHLCTLCYLDSPDWDDKHKQRTLSIAGAEKILLADYKAGHDIAQQNGLTYAKLVLDAYNAPRQQGDSRGEIEIMCATRDTARMMPRISKPGKGDVKIAWVDRF